MTFDKALDLLRYLPRINLHNIRDNPYSVLQRSKNNRSTRGQRKKLSGHGHKGAKAHCSYPPIGYEGWGKTPFYQKVPKEPYYANHMRREYPPLSLLQLQRMIDAQRLDPKVPIDITSICRTNIYSFDPLERHYGIHLTDEGLDNFKSKIFIEVQHAKEQVIAAVERNGGVIITAYYDVQSLLALQNPLKFFKQGIPIPKRELPPEDALDYYMDPKFRGYLADPEKIAEERFILAQKYGYELPDISEDEEIMEMLQLVKDPRQVFAGLQPGWLVNLKDKTILQPKLEKLRAYYSS